MQMRLGAVHHTNFQLGVIFKCNDFCGSWMVFGRFIQSGMETMRKYFMGVLQLGQNVDCFIHSSIQVKYVITVH